MTNIALTGGIACGKSLVGTYLAEQGVAVCEADDLAHSILKKGNPTFDKVLSAFGQDIVGTDGEVDRSILGNIVFSDAAALKKLNSIIHPEVKHALGEWLDLQKDIACAIVPLLYEADMDHDWDAIVAVSSARTVQMERLSQRGRSERDAHSRIEAQMQVGRKMELVDFVIVNNGTKDLLKRQTLAVLNNIRRR
jgi:dephospho-CoA kinase